MKTEVKSSTTMTDTVQVESIDMEAKAQASIVERDYFRNMVSNLYGIQKLRVQCGNRLVNSVMGLAEKSRNRTEESVKAEIEARKAKETQNAQEDEQSDDDAETQKILKCILRDYVRITDIMSLESRKKAITDTAIKKAIDKASEGGTLMIGDVYNYKMAQQYEAILELEENAAKAISKEVQKHPMWDRFFANVRGCGPIMAAVCLAYFDPYKARHPAGFWKYAGLDVVINEDGTTEGRSKKHTEVRTYIGKDGEVTEKNGITYNSKLKAKLIGVLGSGFVKHAKKNGELVGYGAAYYNYKHRLEQRSDAESLTKFRKHKMAVRFAVKQFVRDLWIAWRQYEGLEVGEPYYEVAKLGHKPHGFNY